MGFSLPPHQPDLQQQQQRLLPQKNQTIAKNVLEPVLHLTCHLHVSVSLGKKVKIQIGNLQFMMVHTVRCTPHAKLEKELNSIQYIFYIIR